MTSTAQTPAEPRCADCGHGTLAHNAIGGACTQCDCGRFRAAPAQCRRCKRHNLRTPASRAAGIGPRCAAIEAAFQGLNPKQCDKARKLAASGTVTKIRDGVYSVPSGSGKQPYITFVSGDCRCEWGYHRKPGDKVCYHVGTARLLDRSRLTPRRAATRALFVLSA